MRPYRRERIAAAIRNIISEAIAHKMHDPRIDTLAGVTRVEVSSDLLSATVYLSVPGGDTAERKTMAAIRHATGFLQSMVASQLNLRQCPMVTFAIDEGVREAREIIKILDENRRAKPELFEADGVGNGDEERDADWEARMDEPRGTGDASPDRPKGAGG